MGCGLAGAATLPVQLLPAQTAGVFCGAARRVSVTFSNSSSHEFESDVTLRIWQATSATAAEYGGRPWKHLRILPHQVILEITPVDFPIVRSETKFLIQWLANTNQVIGISEIQVYPTNLLGELKPLLKDGVLGVLDPSHELTPLLKQNNIDFVNLEEKSVDDFPGKLAILGPFRNRAQVPEKLPVRCQKLAAKGVAAVWIQFPPQKNEKLTPSFYCVPSGTNAFVIVQPGLVASLAEQPESQANLVQFCRLALNPEPPALPIFDPCPL